MLTQIQNSETQSTTGTAILEPQRAMQSDTQTPVLGKQGEPADKKPRILEEVVIEEVSIDGMCGVY